jgi:hypothetical protein
MEEEGRGKYRIDFKWWNARKMRIMAKGFFKKKNEKI